MLGIDEGKELTQGSIRMLFLTVVFSSAFTMIVLVSTFWNARMKGYETSFSRDGHSNWTQLMQSNPVPVRSVYTLLQTAENKDFYFIAITYRNTSGSTVTTAYTTNENLDNSQTDRTAFESQIQTQFDTSIESTSAETVDNIPEYVRSILHRFSDKMCEVYYNPEHESEDQYFPPYLYIVVDDTQIVGM